VMTSKPSQGAVWVCCAPVRSECSGAPERRNQTVVPIAAKAALSRLKPNAAPSILSPTLGLQSPQPNAACRCSRKVK